MLDGDGPGELYEIFSTINEFIPSNIFPTPRSGCGTHNPTLEKESSQWENLIILFLSYN